MVSVLAVNKWPVHPGQVNRSASRRFGCAQPTSNQLSLTNGTRLFIDAAETQHWVPQRDGYLPLTGVASAAAFFSAGLHLCCTPRCRRCRRSRPAPLLGYPKPGHRRPEFRPMPLTFDPRATNFAAAEVPVALCSYRFVAVAVSLPRMSPVQTVDKRSSDWRPLDLAAPAP